MKLRKMITVSAAALMLAGVGASATNAGVPVHASRRTVRISRLRTNKSQLERQDTFLNRKIRSNKSQLKQINHEMARLSHRGLRKGKRSEKNVKRHKRTRKHVKKNTRKAPRRVNRNKKLTPQQKQQQQILKQYIAASKKRIPTHVQMNGEVYKTEVNGLNQIASKPTPYMSLKAYVAKNHKALAKNKKVMTRLSNQYKKISGQKAKLKFLRSKVVKHAEKVNQEVNVFGVQAPKSQNTKK